jgi:hypothetical protein
MVDKISKELDLSASLSVSALVDQAIEFLGIGDRAVFRVDSAKADAILKEILLMMMLMMIGDSSGDVDMSEGLRLDCCLSRAEDVDWQWWN